MWYHGTSKQAYESIHVEGFKIIPNIARRFGNGIYFSDQQDTAYYGEHTIQADINLNALEMTSSEWMNVEDMLIRIYQNDYTLHIASYVQDQGYNALLIDWNSGKELIVFDTKAITIH